VTLVAIAALRVRERARIDRQVPWAAAVVTTVVDSRADCRLYSPGCRAHPRHVEVQLRVAGVHRRPLVVYPARRGLGGARGHHGVEGRLGTQVSGFLCWTMLLLTIIEVPLVCYLVRPHKTLALIMQVQHWLQGHIRQIMQFDSLGFGFARWSRTGQSLSLPGSLAVYLCSQAEFLKRALTRSHAAQLGYLSGRLVSGDREDDFPCTRPQPQQLAPMFSRVRLVTPGSTNRAHM